MSAPLVSMARGEDRESTGTFMGILICEVSYFLIVILNIFGLSKGNINTILWIGIFSFAIYLSNSLLPEAETVEKGDIIEEAEIIELRNECKTCGAITKRSTKFCSKCGNKI